jgi:dTDP-glucose pyrophosphorylase
MKVIIPMAGRGSRFADQGFETPKPLIEVKGKPMVIWALESINNLPVSEIGFVILKEHEQRYNVSGLLQKQLTVPVRFFIIDDVTEGQLCTVLSAGIWLDTDEDVLVAASDTIVKGNLIKDVLHSSWDGIISVTDLPGNQWSFARINDEHEVVEVAEKVRISDHASTGLYYFRKGKDLVSLGASMIRNEEKTRGEYYVIPVYSKMIASGMKVGISRANEMWDLGTPEAKARFEQEYPG